MESNQPKSTVLRNFLITCGVLLVLGAGYYLLTHRVASSSGVVSTATSTEATTSSLVIPGVGTVNVNAPAGTYTVTEVPQNTSTPAPDSKTLSIPNKDLPADFQAGLKTQFATAQATIAKTPYDFDAWMKLGQLRKMAGDYKEAAKDWEYVSTLYPTNRTSFDSLGDLYMNFLKDYPNAERNYKKGIAVSSDDLNAYHALFALYTDLEYKKGTTAAIDILKAGIKANPKAIDLYVLLARYLAKQGDTASAKIQYDLAIKIAQDAGNATAVSQLQQERAGLQ